MSSVRNILAGLAVAFTAYLAARGLSWTEPVVAPLVIWATFALYLLTTWLCVFWEPRPAPSGDETGRRRSRLPRPAAILAVATAIVVPGAIAYAVGPDAVTESYATWYLGGIGALMTIVMVRRRQWVAWAGMTVLALQSMIFMGPLNALALGLVGSFVWVAVAQLIMFQLDRAALDTAQLAQLQRAASGWQASQVVRQRERRVQVQEALAIAGPVLTRTVATGGLLDEEDRLRARLAEGSLRDELRGPRLLDDAVRAALEQARRRGANVTVLDEGGLEGIDEESLTVIRAELADTLRSADSDRLYIRTAPHESVAVTVVGRSESADGLSDEDAVDLWREIERPGMTAV